MADLHLPERLSHDEKRPRFPRRIFSALTTLGLVAAAGYFFAIPADKQDKATLGLRFLHGDEVKADPARAVALFREGATAGDHRCMFLLAQGLERGAGTVPVPEEARTWYLRAAEAGNEDALTWCSANGVPVSARPPAPSR